jgi:opacity protein-like surface antigen
MVRVKILGLAGAAVLSSAAAFAADFPPALPPMPQFVQPAPVVQDFSGWYLRGDVGVGMQSFGSFQHTQTNSAFVWPASWRIDQRDIGSANFVGFGIGYNWNSWMRFDFTGEYRAKAGIKVIGSYTEFCPDGRCFDVYDAKHAAWVFLANAYLDLGTWWCLTPFVGVGVGSAWHSVTGIHDVGFISDGTTGFGFADADKSNFTFAWAAHAGLAYTVTNNFKVELAYRYLNLGSATTGTINCASSGCATTGPRAFYSVGEMSSHDIKLGMRWSLQPEQVAPAPQPIYMPAPPLMRRG